MYFLKIYMIFYKLYIFSEEIFKYIQNMFNSKYCKNKYLIIKKLN